MGGKKRGVRRAGKVRGERGGERDSTRAAEMRGNGESAGAKRTCTP